MKVWRFISSIVFIVGGLINVDLVSTMILCRSSYAIKNAEVLSKFRLFATHHRLERIISNRGVGSRNEVSKLLKQGRVCVNGKVIKTGSIKYPIDINIEIDGKLVTEIALLAIYHKPVNVVSSVGDPWGRPSLSLLYDTYPFLKNMHPVGRLDRDTSGLLLFSKDGQLTQHLLNPQSKVSRVYEAHVKGKVDFEALEATLQSGVSTTDGVFPAKLLHSEAYEEKAENVIRWLAHTNDVVGDNEDGNDEDQNQSQDMLTSQPFPISNSTSPITSSSSTITAILKNNDVTTTLTSTTFSASATITCSRIRLSVTEGKYRMVRRILHNAGHSVMQLHRSRYGEISLDGLEVGQVRNCTAIESKWASSLIS